jgi:hypothetical protein
MVQKTLQSNTTCGSMDHQNLQVDEFLSSKLWMKHEINWIIFLKWNPNYIQLMDVT